MAALQELKALAKIIDDAIAVIESTLAEKNLTFPSLASPMSPELEAARMLPEIEASCSLVISAATQLVYAVRSPLRSLTAVGFQHHLSAALGVASAANVAEACREAGPQGAHVTKIAGVRGIDPSSLARILRLLATNHIFVETAPDVFANNCISSALDTGKSSRYLVEHPTSKYVGTSGITANVEHSTDEGLKASSYLQDVLLDPKLTSSQDPNDSALNLAFNTKLSAWEWYEAKGNEKRRLRLGINMDSSKHATSLDAINQGFDWSMLEKDSIVVDVGGGVGSQSMTLAKNFPHLRIIVQDREQTVKDAFSFWDNQLPGALESGQVVLQAHDFFTPQPAKNVAVFIVRQVLHDWPDSHCIRILRHLRRAAEPCTRLMIIDNLMAYACAENEVGDVSGVERVLPPSPLLPNGGHASTVAYLEDIHMMALANGQERTLKQVRDLMGQSGWKLVSVHQSAASAWGTQKAIGIPLKGIDWD